MAQYTYRCDRCEKETTIERSMSAESVPNVLCPCGGSMKRVYSVPGISFKGKGFYSTGG